MAEAIMITRDETGIRIVSSPLELAAMSMRDLVAQALTIIDDDLTRRAVIGVVATGCPPDDEAR